MGKFSKKYNQDRKQIRLLLKKFDSIYNRYKDIIEQATYGHYDTVKRYSIPLLDQVEEHRLKYLRQNDRVKKIMVQKWIKKYGKQVSNPFQQIKDDILEMLQAVQTRESYLEMKGLK